MLIPPPQPAKLLLSAFGLFRHRKMCGPVADLPKLVWLHFVQGGVFPNPNSDGATLRVSTQIEDLEPGKHAAVQVRLTLREAGTDKVVVLQAS